MIEAMRRVVPDVRIDVQYAVSDMWAKSAELVVDDGGRLTVWTPPEFWGPAQTIETTAMAVPA